MADLSAVNGKLALAPIDGSVRAFLVACEGLALPTQGPSVVDTLAFLGYARRAAPPGPVREALDWLVGFAEVRGILHGFPHFPRTSVATMAAIRLLNPTSAYQGATETCGPTAITIDQCRNRPREWVNTQIALATHGSARINTLEMKP
ncbi:MAG: hypothetical protein AB7O38_28590, partial [Pirellulaceae bacterium]